MRTRIVLSVAVAALGIVALAQARNDMLMLPLDDVLKLKKTKEIIGSDIRLYFADQTPERAVGQYLGDLIVQGKGDQWTRKGNQSSQREDIPTCKDALRDALTKMIEQARKRGAAAVIKIVSYYKYMEKSSATEYECHAGESRAVVELKGVAVRLDEAPAK